MCVLLVLATPSPGQRRALLHYFLLQLHNKLTGIRTGSRGSVWVLETDFLSLFGYIRSQHAFKNRLLREIRAACYCSPHSRVLHMLRLFCIQQTVHHIFFLSHRAQSYLRLRDLQTESGFVDIVRTLILYWLFIRSWRSETFQMSEIHVSGLVRTRRLSFNQIANINGQ